MPRFLVALGLLAFVPLACANDISVFDEDGATDDDGGPSATVGSGGAGGQSGVGGTVTVGPSTTSGPTTDTTVTTTAVTATTTTAVTSTSTGDPGVSIPCGNQTCTGTDICCVHFQSASQDKCAPAGQCGSGYLEVACNGPMDCMGNQVCCGLWSQQTGYQEIGCMASCSGSGGNVGITMCGDDPSACMGSQSCNPSMFLPQGHAFCQ